MNRKQLIVLWVGIGIVCLMILFPPYCWSPLGVFAGYGPIWPGRCKVMTAPAKVFYSPPQGRCLVGIANDDSNIYSDPESSDSLDIIGSVKSGDTVWISGRSKLGLRYSVAIQGRDDGWIDFERVNPMDTIAPEAAETKGDASSYRSERAIGRVGYVEAGRSVIHSSTSFHSSVLYSVAKGTPLSVVSTSGDWYGVLMSDGSTGWVRSSDLRITDLRVVADNSSGGDSNESNPFADLFAPHPHGGGEPITSSASHPGWIRHVSPAVYRRLPS